MQDIEDIVTAVALLIAGPMVGVEVAVATFTNPILERLPEDAYGAARSGSSRLLGKVMPFWYIATLLVLIVAAVLTTNGWLIASAALMALVVLLTVTLLVPVNNRISAWSETTAASRDLARRWDRLHQLRVAILVVMFVLLVVGVTA